MTPVSSLRRDAGFQRMVGLLWARRAFDTHEIAAMITAGGVFGSVHEADVYGALARIKDFTTFGAAGLPDRAIHHGAGCAPDGPALPSLGVSSLTDTGANAGVSF